MHSSYKPEVVLLSVTKIILRYFEDKLRVDFPLEVGKLMSSHSFCPDFIGFVFYLVETKLLLTYKYSESISKNDGCQNP